MLGFILFLLVLWLVLAVLGIIVEGLFWLTVIGVILFLATAVWGWLKRQRS
ncbi:LPXTG cell wall anchor domain-containing protein [Allosalinactinospora lopnorensis]|uniref:LPXTG cell wall anchor domain-containing protein n=1 Tax=Allosalinactinospora lopnorensis TaxID=1352348 RepID=UPI000623FFC2|nr:LPXTG cell wall anchor domain-containing protein [Allosalinactinospora lopnorensis]